MKDTTHAAHAIFQQPWWLEAVAPGRWGEATVVQSGRVVARLPYVRGRRFGFSTLTMPAMTRLLGPWVERGTGKYVERLARYRQLTSELIDQLPPSDHFHHSFAPEVDNWYPFYLRGYQTSVRYTFRFNDIGDPDHLWGGFRDNIRRHIRKAQGLVKVRDDLSIDDLLRSVAMTYERQGRRIPFDLALVRRLDQAAAARGARMILGAEDSEGRLHGATYFVWDDQCAFWIMSGADPELRASGATSLMVWEALKRLSGRTRTFDFEGSMVPAIERFLGAFGGKKVPYFDVTRSSRRLQALMAARTLARLAVGKDP